MKVISLKEAKERGLKHYFTGKPCKYGHKEKRKTSNGHCLACHRESEAQRRKDPQIAEYYTNYNKKYREENPEYFLEHKRKNKNKYYEATKSWKQNNKPRLAFLEMKRKAAILKRTPKWADMDAISFFYECCPAGCHVDHIIPLRGKKVSGLHIAENLQWLPAKENMRKGNSWN